MRNFTDQVLKRCGYRLKADCEAPGIDLQTPLRQNMKECRPRWWVELLQRVRERIEMVIANSNNASGWRKPARAMPGI